MGTGNDLTLEAKLQIIKRLKYVVRLAETYEQLSQRLGDVDGTLEMVALVVMARHELDKREERIYDEIKVLRKKLS